MLIKLRVKKCWKISHTSQCGVLLTGNAVRHVTHSHWRIQEFSENSKKRIVPRIVPPIICLGRNRHQKIWRMRSISSCATVTVRRPVGVCHQFGDTSSIIDCSSCLVPNRYEITILMKDCCQYFWVNYFLRDLYWAYLFQYISCQRCVVSWRITPFSTKAENSKSTSHLKNSFCVARVAKPAKKRD